MRSRGQEEKEVKEKEEEEERNRHPPAGWGPPKRIPAHWDGDGDRLAGGLHK